MLTNISKEDLILVTGGHGFIGSHIVQRFLHMGHHRIRIADIVETCPFDLIPSHGHEVMIGNLCDPSFCRRALDGATVILHFAANMGGMGTIHSSNDFIIYRENQAMIVNLLSNLVPETVKLFFYASSACVYPESLQESFDYDLTLREDDVWRNPPPHPQGLYGLEKLVSELLLEQMRTAPHHLRIRIARFHNIYGPRGAWYNGREKAPAALLRKALVASRLAETKPPSIEVWGGGNQRRSFLYIDDCVDAVLRFLESSGVDVVNIGSTESISIKDLAFLAARLAGLDESQVQLHFGLDKPVGVASRNSNNDTVGQLLNWEPKITLQEGMRKTAEWMRGEVDMLLKRLSPAESDALLASLESSHVLDLRDGRIVFAILLPITSRGSKDPNDCLVNVQRFTHTLVHTTQYEVNALGEGYGLKVYVVIDYDDEFLLREENGLNRVEAILKQHYIESVTTIISEHPRGHVCALRRDAAYHAWRDRCDYYVLMGDDVVLQDIGWMRAAHSTFTKMASSEGLPFGMGCAAFTDITFPGMPTFPIVHRTHMDIFEGQVVPECFINQDGDPFIFQLYRRWGCAGMFAARIQNEVGGSDEARYEKVHAKNWTFEPLRDASSIISKWRVQLDALNAILSLEASPSCSVMFIIIIDDPLSPHIATLEQKYAHRSDVRIRVNKHNLGASESRNRGLAESAADWVHFLDDDVKPHPNLLREAEAAIRSQPDAAGFVGNAQFPLADSIFTTAVHLSGVTYFWDIATKMEEDLPWGVTANLIALRAERIWFSPDFPKTGGGEDIDFCRKQREVSILKNKKGFYAAPKVTVVHPWWEGGKRSYWRFYKWSYGDGGLIKKYPDLAYWDSAPNSAELFLCCGILVAFGVIHGLLGWQTANRWFWLKFAVQSAIAIVLANIIHDGYRHLWRDSQRWSRLKTSLRGMRWFLAVIESALIRMASEGGRLIGLLERGEILLIGSRFDWFAGRVGEGPRNEEKRNNVERSILVVVLVAVISSCD